VVIDGTQTSAALADQVKSLDWKVRKAKRKGQVTSTELAEVRAKSVALIQG
jgi:mRNA interferase MazF